MGERLQVGAGPERYRRCSERSRGGERPRRSRVEAPSTGIGIPSGFDEPGVEEDVVPRLAEKTGEIQRLLVGNPCRVDREDLEAILESAR
ncbi:MULTISPECIES: hypothetical protein [Natrialbaceae]|uniref:hypothetical protein n=1 Tax=Natrialbaceae TaxID=1644061 RepID=UPI00207CEFD1|nr:hypothetical protein [Natronococcus sp. CG52]